MKNMENSGDILHLHEALNNEERQLQVNSLRSEIQALQSKYLEKNVQDQETALLLKDLKADVEQLESFLNAKTLKWPDGEGGFRESKGGISDPDFKVAIQEIEAHIELAEQRVAGEIN